jgi:hypothetical protein
MMPQRNLQHQVFYKSTHAVTIEEVTSQLYQASEKNPACRVSLNGEPIPRTACPYGICKTPRNQIVLVCWQTAGFTKAGDKEGHRNLQLDRIVELETLDWHFQKRDDFNPLDG